MPENVPPEYFTCPSCDYQFIDTGEAGVCDNCGHVISKPKPTTVQPPFEVLEFWAFDGVAEATDGCRVEPDGECEHGHVSWLRWLGYI